MSDKKFDTWWNEHYFHTTHPLYPTFKKLHRLSVNLDYIDSLCGHLRFGDYFQLLTPRSKVDRKQVSIGKIFRTRFDEFRALLEVFGTVVVGFTVERIVELHLKREDPSTLLSTQEVKKILSTSCFAIAGMVSNNILKTAESSRAQQVQLQQKVEQFKSDYTHVPIISLLMDYNKPILQKRGNKADPWGTLFLLAVTEHVRAKTGRPHYGDAGQLLGKVRLEYQKEFTKLVGRFPKTNAQTATVRVKNFKIANSSWEKAVSHFVDQFRVSSERQN